MAPARMSLLDQAKAIFADNGWPEADLHRFRMTVDDDQSDNGSDDNDDDASSGDRDDDDDVVKMRRALAKANKEAEKFRLKVKEFEDASKSEQEKLAESLRQQEQRAETAALSALRYEIALDKGIPKAIASRLQGSTRDEMEADADELMKTLNGNGRRPPSFDGGAKDDKAPKDGSFLAQALASRGR